LIIKGKPLRVKLITGGSTVLRFLKIIIIIITWSEPKPNLENIGTLELAAAVTGRFGKYQVMDHA
jgi:hypothetical protein